MIELNLPDKTQFKIRNSYSEITLRELDLLTNIFDSKKSDLEQWIEVLIVLSNLDEEAIDNLPLDTVAEIITNLFKDEIKEDLRTEIVIGDKTLKVPEKSYSIRQGILIEKIYKDKTIDLKLCNTLSVILSPSLKDDALKDTLEAIIDQPASLFMPTITRLGINLTNNLKSMLNDNKAA